MRTMCGDEIDPDWEKLIRKSADERGVDWLIEQFWLSLEMQGRLKSERYELQKDLHLTRERLKIADTTLDILLKRK